MMNAAESRQGMSLGMRIKIIVSAVLLVLMLIVVFQNTESVTTHVLLAEFTMPRALLLLLMLGIGFAAGVLLTGVVYRRRRK